MHKSGSNIRRLAEILKKNPGDSFSKFALALELLKQNEVSKSKILFESVLEQDPEYLGVYYHLGKLYERIDRLHDAKKIYESGVEIAERQGNNRTRLELLDALELLNIELNLDE